MSNKLGVTKQAIDVPTTAKVRLFVRHLLGPKKIRIKNLDKLKSMVDKGEKLLASNSNIPSNLRNNLSATIDKAKKEIEGINAYIHNAKAKQKDALYGLGLTGLLGTGGLAAYLGHKISKNITTPDFINEYKLEDGKTAEYNWVSGFIDKCAEYDVDGLALLDKIMSGEIKSANVFSGVIKSILPYGMLAGSAWLLHRALKNRKKDVSENMSNITNLIKNHENAYNTNAMRSSNPYPYVDYNVRPNFNIPAQDNNFNTNNNINFK